ncbi:MAG: amino acid permease [Acidaminococcaceae bacterium]|nr:amino acid permease [Acidaminococcaceae bacterium]
MTNHCEVTAQGSRTGLQRYLSPLGAWALAFGCAVGWGAFVMPGNLFLPEAGPLGTILAMLIGGLVMILIGVNYHYMMQRYPDAGGAFTYTKKELGYDHGFLSSWFLVLTYISILWANATALALLGRRLLRGALQFGFHYTVLGHDVYFGEILVAMAALVLFALVCMGGGKLTERVQILLAILLFVGISIAFGTAMSRYGDNLAHYAPAFSPKNTPLAGTLKIIALTPWAFVGFESISHSAQEFRFPVKKSLSVLAAAVFTAALAYIMTTIVAASVLPDRTHTTWYRYVIDLQFMPGLKSLPAFFAVRSLLGENGFYLIGITVLGAIFTGILGNYVAASRLLYAMAEDRMLPGWFGRLNGRGVPCNAVLFILLFSVPVLFVGRTAVAWIVDVTTIGATIVYGYTCFTAYRCAKRAGDKTIKMTGLAGTVAAVLLSAYLFKDSLSMESYLIFVVWSVLGSLLFLILLRNDKEARLGKATQVWLWLVSLIAFASTIWIRQEFHAAAEHAIDTLNLHNANLLRSLNVAINYEQWQESRDFHTGVIAGELESALNTKMLVMFGMMFIVMMILFLVFRLILARERTTEWQKRSAEQSTRAKSTFLSNMSHDIRTPMNAIIGYTMLARKEKELSPKAAEYLTKIETSSQHLLALINDVLDMSRIESGKVELEPKKTNLVKTMDEVRAMFQTQMETKGLHYTVTSVGVTNRTVMCDVSRLNRILLNLISNAYKFTPQGGSVAVTLHQTGSDGETGFYHLHVKDTGIGMSKEFAARVFEAYERERTNAVDNIQGTGLGMAITKSLVDLMGGTIEVKTEQGKGTEFIINVGFPLAEEEPETEADAGSKAPERQTDFSNKRLLLVEDNVINREIAQMILMELGFKVETAEDGKIALDKVASSKPGYYDGVLMDIQMPVMNGYEATAAIRALPDSKLSKIPIMAMTANAFAEDIQHVLDAGMNGHIAKPINIPDMVATLRKCLK